MRLILFLSFALGALVPPTEGDLVPLPSEGALVPLPFGVLEGGNLSNPGPLGDPFKEIVLEVAPDYCDGNEKGYIEHVSHVGYKTKGV